MPVDEVLADSGPNCCFDAFAEILAQRRIVLRRTRSYRPQNRGGNCQLNKAIHTVALAQISRPGTEGRLYYQRCLDRGKTKRQAIRALNRRVSDRI